MKRNDLSLQTASLLHSDALIHPAEETQAEARARMTLYRTQQQRGPPCFAGLTLPLACGLSKSHTGISV